MASTQHPDPAAMAAVAKETAVHDGPATRAREGGNRGSEASALPPLLCLPTTLPSHGRRVLSLPATG